MSAQVVENQDGPPIAGGPDGLRGLTALTNRSTSSTDARPSASRPTDTPGSGPERTAARCLLHAFCESNPGHACGLRHQVLISRVTHTVLRKVLAAPKCVQSKARNLKSKFALVNLDRLPKSLRHQAQEVVELSF